MPSRDSAIKVSRGCASSSLSLWLLLTFMLLVAVRSSNDIYRQWPKIDRQKNLRRRRHLTNKSSVVTTSTCSQFRTEPFREKLQLKYFYMVEFQGLNGHSLRGVESAILRLVLTALNACSEEGMPVYAVDLQSTHIFADQGFCFAKASDNNKCSVIEGLTTIFLDSNATVARDVAYDAIASGLSNQQFMLSFEPNFVSGRFLRSVKETLQILDGFDDNNDDSSTKKNNNSGKTSVTAQVAIAAASLAFVIAAIFSFGILRRRMKEKRRNRGVGKSQRSKRLHDSHNGVGHGRQFGELYDEEGFTHAGSGLNSIIEEAGGANNHTDDDRFVTWSISDITSDSGSIRSILSKTTDRLERIEEETGDEDHPQPIEEEQQQQQEDEDKEKPSIEEYTKTYAEHKHRLADLIKSACYEAHFDDVDKDEDDAKVTPKTTDTSPSSFGSTDQESFEEIDWSAEPPEAIDASQQGQHQDAPQSPINDKKAQSVAIEPGNNDIERRSSSLEGLANGIPGVIGQSPTADTPDDEPNTEVSDFSDTSLNLWLRSLLLNYSPKETRMEL